MPSLVESKAKKDESVVPSGDEEMMETAKDDCLLGALASIAMAAATDDVKDLEGKDGVCTPPRLRSESDDHLNHRVLDSRSTSEEKKQDHIDPVRMPSSSMTSTPPYVFSYYPPPPHMHYAAYHWPGYAYPAPGMPPHYPFQPQMARPGTKIPIRPETPADAPKPGGAKVVSPPLAASPVSRRFSDDKATREKRRASMGKWSEDEDEILRLAVQEFGGKNWKRIAGRLRGRTDVQCLHRWQKVLKPGLVKGPWTTEEDGTVARLVQLHGTKKWSMIARQLNGRLGKQCRERWYNHLVSFMVWIRACFVMHRSSTNVVT
jgi:hypothetical protein